MPAVKKLKRRARPSYIFLLVCPQKNGTSREQDERSTRAPKPHPGRRHRPLHERAHPARPGHWSYTGHVLDLDTWEKDGFGVEIDNSGIVMSPFSNGIVDFDAHPFAAANEPEIGGGGPNMALRTETHDNGVVTMHILVFYAVKTIEAGDELLWYYGHLYERFYEADPGDDALRTMRFPKLSEARVERLVRERPDGVHVLPDSESSESSSQGSDPSFTPGS